MVTHTRRSAVALTVLGLFIFWALAVDPTARARLPAPGPPESLPLDEPTASPTIALRLDAMPLSPLSLVNDDPPPRETATETITARPGDSLISLLQHAGIALVAARSAIDALVGKWDPRALKTGQQIALLRDDAGVKQLRLTPDLQRDLVLTRGTDGNYIASVMPRDILTVPLRIAGTIDSSLFEAAAKAGLPQAVMSDVIHAFSYDVDFQRDFQPGDKFEIVYKRYLNEAGELAKSGDIDFASLTLSGRELKLYRYALPDGRVDWFNPKGDSVRKALLRTPIDGARITSGFGLRMHPILGYSLMHKGVDFGAPMGTPIFAAGDGVIAMIGPSAGYGNYIRIKHNATYATAYGYMSRFAGGLHTGSRVRQGQVIAYVGMTGRATGPHLHFEVLINGQQVNPQSIKLPTGEKLQGKQLKQFLAFVAQLDRQRRDLAQKALVAQGNTE